MDSVSSQSTPNQEKDQRSPAQQKIDSQILFAIYQMRGEAGAKGAPSEPIQLEKDDQGRILIDVRVPVTREILSSIEKLGGTIVSNSEKNHSIISYLPLEQVEPLARLKEVKFIAPKAQSTTN